jgi:hypothetical protein
MKRTSAAKIEKGRRAIYASTFHEVKRGMGNYSDTQDTAADHATRASADATPEEALQAYRKSRRNKVLAGIAGVAMVSSPFLGAKMIHDYNAEKTVTPQERIATSANNILNAYDNAAANHKQLPRPGALGVTIPLKNGKTLVLGEQSPDFNEGTGLPTPAEATHIMAFVKAEDGLESKITLTKDETGNWESSYQLNDEAAAVHGSSTSRDGTFGRTVGVLEELTELHPGEALPPLDNPTDK